jgi:hypothetical protein
MPPGGVLVVVGVMDETTVEDADQSVAEVSERGVMGISSGSPVVVEGPCPR